MTITEEEIAIQQDDSLELYEITSVGDVLYLTSYYKDYTVGGQLYTAVAGLRRSGFQQTTDHSPAGCTVMIPSSYEELIGGISNVEALQNLSVVIKRYFINADLVKNIFSGSALGGISQENGLCSIVFKDLLYILDREICRVRLQSLCNNRLGDDICTINKELFSISSVGVTVDSTRKILVSSAFTGSGHPDGYFTNGIAVVSGVKRTITKHVGDTINIAFPIAGLAPPIGTLDEVYAGCDKTPQTCRDRFSNLINFVGMPYIPTKDPLVVPIANVV